VRVFFRRKLQLIHVIIGKIDFVIKFLPLWSWDVFWLFTVLGTFIIMVACSADFLCQVSFCFIA